MIKAKKIISFALVVLTLAGVLASCSKEKVPTGGEDSAATTAGTDIVDDNSLEGVLASFGDVKYDGALFNIATSNIINSSLTLQQAPYEEENGDRINDALYKRDALLEERFGTDIVYTLIEPDAEFKLYDQVSQSIIAGDNDYDLVFGNMKVYAMNFINNKLIRNMAAIGEIDLTKPWWHQTACRDLNVGGTMLLATGDITPRYVLSSFVILFNQKLFTDNGWEFSYQAVKDGKWTMDMMLGYAKGVYQDLNSNNKSDYNDFFGFTNEGWAYPFLNGFNESVVDITGGEVKLNFEAENVYNKAMKVAELFGLPDTFYKNENTQYDSLDIFSEDRALLTSQTATNLALLKNMNSDYGVLPLPKYDEAQDGYYSFVNGYCATAVMIPITVTDTSRVGTLTEAMAAASRFMVTPEAYEVTLLTKQTRDEESVEMLKLAAEGAMYDMSVYFNWGNVQSQLDTAMMSGGSKFSSIAAKLRDKTLKAANESLELFKNIN